MVGQEREMERKILFLRQVVNFLFFAHHFSYQNNRSLMKDDRMESNKKKNVVDVAELEDDFM